MRKTVFHSERHIAHHVPLSVNISCIEPAIQYVRSDSGAEIVQHCVLRFKPATRLQTIIDSSEVLDN